MIVKLNAAQAITLGWLLCRLIEQLLSPTRSKGLLAGAANAIPAARAGIKEVLVAEAGFEHRDLELMGLASCHYSTPRVHSRPGRPGCQA